ncbi:MAG: aminodeoxychorismate synthase, component I [Bacillota bacterium]|nr:aminodeoxychorismate synthase, component I [Bacillota bacterium]MDP4169030.1 aminodeoxychorismate synthase, component I [Bacillota bacterium]
MDFFHQYRQLSSSYRHHVLLESGRGGRYSIAAFEPASMAIGIGNQLEYIKNGLSEIVEGNPLHVLKNYLDGIDVEEDVTFAGFGGGAIGYISYDYARNIERLPEIAKDVLELPELYFFFHDEWFVFDHHEKELSLSFLYDPLDKKEVEARVKHWETLWTQPFIPSDMLQNRISVPDEKEVSIEESDFRKAVEMVQNYISEGDVFQVNLSVRQTKPITVPALDVYEQLRRINPSPYMGYFHTPAFQIVSGSPELLIKKEANEVSTRPIAGTRSRGRDDEEDQALAKELIENEKERAEHVMLVDLERNDLGRVCEYGTVEVDEFMVIEKYSHVMHIVSNVRGQIATGKSGIDLIDAVFPGGTITGAPKVRTMEIIEELEPTRRGPYTGSLGWIGYNGDVELNIMIRTMLVQNGQAHVQAGAGIVIDSNPKHEYKESLKKARALWKAKECAEMGENHDLYD